MMKKFTFPAIGLIFMALSVVLTLSSAVPIHAASTADECDAVELAVAWQSWKSEHSKAYASQQEDALRCRVFM
jgi:hypothetical protein